MPLRAAHVLLMLLIVPTLVSADSSRVKNVLFIVSDDLKAGVLGCYGDRFCKTPNIDRLAREGMVFDRAYCQGMACRPSRRSFMFGRYVGTATESSGHTSMAQHFKNNGWYSARVGKIYHMRVPGDIIPGTNGPDHAASWTERFNCPGQEAHTPGAYALLNKNIFTTELPGRESTGDRYRMFVSVKAEGDGSDQPDSRAAVKAIELLNKHKERPFFLAVGFVRPHYPMVAPTKYFEDYPYAELPLPKTIPNDIEDMPKKAIGRNRSQTNGIGRYPDNIKRMWAAYYASVTFMDKQVGRVIDELDRLGLRDSTAIVFTSDHGYHLGEHGFWEKSNLHEEVIRVPLIISSPGKQPGRSKALVELVDIFPTVTELAGLKPIQGLHGKSLVPALDDPTTHIRDAAISFLSGGHSLRFQDWAYTHYGDGQEELYNMNQDPHQFTNLAGDPKHKQRVKTFRSALRERLAGIRR